MSSTREGQFIIIASLFNSTHGIPPSTVPHLVDIHALGSQIRPRNINFLHEFCVCLGYIVECEDAVSELEQEVCTERYEGPKWQNWYYLLGDQRWERNEFEVEREVKRGDEKSN